MPTEGSTQNSKTCACKLSNSAFECQAIPSKKHTMRPPFWSRFLTPKWGNRHASFTFAITTAPTPHFGANFESFFQAIHPFKVSEHATKHSSTRVQSSHQKDRLGRPLPRLQFCDKFQLPFLELLIGHFQIQNKTLKALEHLSWMTFQPLCWPMLTLLSSPHRAMLWYAAECGQQLFESSKVHAPRSFKVSQLL